MIKKIILLFSLSLGLFSINFSYAGDALDDVLGSDSDAGDYQIVNEKELHVQNKIKETAKLLLKLTVIIGVAVVLFGGIRFMLSMGDDSKAKKVRNNLIISILGFIIAFGAWLILQLILSAGATISHI